MKKLLNTLYITTEDAYLSLNGETVDVIFGDDTHKQIPLHTLNGIVSFSYKGASPALMGKCAEAGILLSFFTPYGKYLCDTGSCTSGNVYLRRTQFRWADDEAKRLSIVKNMIIGKLYNSKYLILHYMRDHPLQTDCEKIRLAADRIGTYLEAIKTADDSDSIRGIEGKAAAEYFGVFNELILLIFFLLKTNTHGDEVDRSRPPCGGRGLKWRCRTMAYRQNSRPPCGGTWIEISQCRFRLFRGGVVPHAGDVD